MTDATPNSPSATRGMLLIVKRELGQYTSTWSGYIIVAGMLVVTALLYNSWAVGSSPKYSNDVLSDFFYFASGTTIAASVFLSMRLIAEERQTGTLPFLMTSPLTEGQIVLAKFLSALAFLALYLALTAYMPLLIFLNGKVAVGHILGGYLGLLLIGGCALAIGVFSSALLSSQLVSLIVTAVITVTFLLLWLTARLVDGALGDLIASLAIHDKHFRPFMDGTIELSNIVFYVSFTAFFLVLARNVLEARRWRAA